MIDVVSLEARVEALERKIEALCGHESDLPGDVSTAISSGENAVRAVRRWRLMTQKELSETTGLGVNHISRIENGAHFNIRTARTLATALNVRIDDIL